MEKGVKMKTIGELQHSYLGMLLSINKKITLGQAIYRMETFNMYRAKALLIDVKG